MPEERVPTHCPWSQTMPAVVPAHDAITDTHRLQSRAANLAVVSLIGINRVLVSADQGIGCHGVVDVGWCEVEAANDAAVLVHPHMHLVAEDSTCSLSRVQVASGSCGLLTSLLAGRPSVSGGNGPSGGSGGLTAERISEASISVPRFKTKPDFFDLRRNQGKGAFGQPTLGHLFPEAPERGMIRYRFAQRQTQKSPERQAVQQCFFKPWIGQPIPLLQQQRLEQRQRWVSWCSHRSAAQAAQQAPLSRSSPPVPTSAATMRWPAPLRSPDRP